ncbi:hypothetical protein P7228_05200 [Altererythrobacter arenosus]|uniref:Uncharacterized protein n=1 Tax=Altererythrobacter arenosus TaxID=3032592 RepID=A0ABY8FTY2_9SPHN|nr:hypothetical protein [Altererythrobacter sp. CAU 1644]WFL78464.1 hypothetical protein P7228_05200 [Altererythrobacter sp. CAU 1644]
MKKFSALLAVSAASLALAACGSADDASTEATADTVEMPADEALEGVTEEPVADADANAVAEEDDTNVSVDEANAAAEAAADVAADAAAAAEAAEAAATE